jgi:hypothetical protein
VCPEAPSTVTAGSNTNNLLARSCWARWTRSVRWRTAVLATQMTSPRSNQAVLCCEFCRDVCQAFSCCKCCCFERNRATNSEAVRVLALPTAGSAHSAGTKHHCLALQSP